ncbi:MAG TPA: polymer-forming cytoskeletal protein [Caulobacteraceae bacterium]|nr:polymer-forming cytoskeletal protein [Caulobacteraceae bacterium]
MFSKQGSNPSQPSPTPSAPATPSTATPQPATQAAPTPTPEPVRPQIRPQRGSSLIGAEMTFEGDVSGGGEIQIDGTIKGDVRVEHVTVGDGGMVEGGIYAEAVEVRGKVSGSITAKQVRLYGACQVDGDITHEQLAMETGAFFQGRSLRLQRPTSATTSTSTSASASTAATPPSKPELTSAPREANGGGAKAAASPPA